jgi:hydrogenase maturation protease
VKARLPEAVALAVRELADWGFAAVPREPGSAIEPLNDGALALDRYEAGRPAPEEACRVGDARVLARSAAPPTDGSEP